MSCWSSRSCCSVTKPCLTLCEPLDCSTPDSSVLHYPLKFIQTHVHWVRDAIQPSHPLSPPSTLALNLSQHQGLFQWSQLFAPGVQSIGASPSTSVLPMNIQGWFPLGLIGLISLLFKELSKIFSSTTIWNYQIFGTQPSLRSNSHICTWLHDYTNLSQQSDVSAL